MQPGDIGLDTGLDVFGHSALTAPVSHAGELGVLTLVLGITGATVYWVITDAPGRYWNGAAFETYNAAHWATYAVATTELPNYNYWVIFPNGIVFAGTYSCRAYYQQGGSPATSDTAHYAGGGDMYWSGSTELVPVTSVPYIPSHQIKRGR